MALEALEPRTLLATLPVPVVTGQFVASPGATSTTSNESAPIIAVDPTNPNNLVTVYTRNDTSNPQNNNNQTPVIVGGSVSTDAGRSWRGFSLPGALLDVEQGQTNGPRFYSRITDPSVAFDRNGQFYVVVSEHNDDNGSGAIVLHKYGFASGSPTLLIANRVLFQWGQDQAAHPIVVVDNSQNAFTDPATGTTQTDRFAADTTAGIPGNVYVAWDTVDANPTSVGNFNPNAIKLVVSSDGGNQFSAVRTINDGGNQLPERNTTPRLAVSQGRPAMTLSPFDQGVPGGQVTVVWDDFNSLNNANPARDAIKVDRLAGGLSREAVYDTAANPTGINDAVAPASGNHIPATTLFDLPVDFPATAKFTAGDVITDLDVTLSINHTAINELLIRLIPPPGSNLGPITLVNNRTNAAGTTATNIGVAGANLGGPTASGAFLGTTFDAETFRSITNNAGGAASVGHYRPESGGLGGVYGLTAAQLTGTWQLEITDFRNSGTTSARSLVGFALNFTAGLAPGGAAGNADVTLPTGDATDTVTTLVRGAQVPTGTGNFPNQGAQAVTPRGFGPAPVIASDNTLGSFSPFQGRLYVAYAGRRSDTAADNSDIFLLTSDDGGATWTPRPSSFGLARPVNDDLAVEDGFSEEASEFGGGTGRPQFQPNLAVDPTTGTLVASFLDARYDAARARVATTLTTSIDGGASFSHQLLAFANAPETAFDVIEQRDVVLGPIPENQSAGNGLREATYGFGDRSGLAALAGRVYPAFASNLNGGTVGDLRLDIRVAPTQIAVGPRGVDSTMGPVTAITTAVVEANGTTGSRTINGSFAPDGTQQADGFIVTFDRPVDPATVTAADVAVRHLPTTGGAFVAVPVVEVLPIPTVAFDPSFPDAAYNTAFGRVNRSGYTKFLVRFAPQAGAGTYSYSIGPDVRDRIRGATVVPRSTFASTNVPLRIPPGFGTTVGTTTSTLTIAGVPAAQTIADLNVNLTLTHTFDADLVITLIAPDGTTRIPLSVNRGGSGNNFLGTTFDDQAATPIGAGSPPFTGSFQPDGLALTGQGLGLLNGTSPNGTWTLEVADVASGDSGFLQSWSLDVLLTGTPPQSTPGNLMDQDADGLAGEAAVDAYATPRPLNGVPFQAAFDPNTLPLIVPGPRVIATNAVDGAGAAIPPSGGENLALNTTVSAVDVTFDRDMQAASFTAADVVRVLGPAGLVPGPYTVQANPPGTPAALALRTFRIGFPTQQLSGTYTVLLGADILSASGVPVDVNRNAGLEALRTGATAGVTAPLTVASADVPQPLLPRRTTTSTLTVTDAFVIQGVTLALNVTFPNDPDLTATLIAPDGTRVLLFSGVGAAGGQNFGTLAPVPVDTVFDDAAATPIQNGEAPFFGTFRPQGATIATLPSLADLVGTQAAGTWTLEITDTPGNPAAPSSGALNRWSLTFRRPVSGTGTGEPVADRTTAAFRIFTMDPANPLSSNTWTSVGPGSINGNGNSGRIGGIAVDPSDPSGNTVYIGGASGGIWKTTNFLTTDSRGPTYVPLTDFGPTFSLNIGGITVFGRNNNPEQSIVFATTGEGDTGSPGAGILRSMDGGASWTLLDSSTNVVDAANALPGEVVGTPLAISDPRRDHAFVGLTSFKVLVDPRPTVANQAIVYAVFSGAATRAGIWRSLDSGQHWSRMRAGQATDLVFDPASGVINALTNPTGNLLFLYAGFAGEGVYATRNQGQTWDQLTGLPPGHPLIQDAGPPAVAPGTPVPVDPPDRTPNGAKGRIVLAKPELTGDPARDALYQGWLYAAVVTSGAGGRTGGGRLDGLYLTKDANRGSAGAGSQNWTRVRLPNRAPAPGPGGSQGATPSNDGTLGDYDPLGNALFAQGNYDVALAIDPTNPNVVYLGGTQDGNVSGLLRIDTTGISDPYAFFLSNSKNDGGDLRANTNDPIALHQPGTGPSPFLPDPRTTPYLNLLIDPSNSTNATFQVSNAGPFNNSGVAAKWIPFDIEGTDQHRFVTLVDPLTGHTRLIIGDDQGVFTALDNDGEFDLLSGNVVRFDPGIGSAVAPAPSRNGNLGITQFYYGAAQPSNVAAQLAGALFYGQAQDNGFPVSTPNVLTTGNITWFGPEGDGTGVATDQTGTGTLYRYNWPCCGGNITDFFRVKLPGQAEVGRTTGLVGNDPGSNVPDRQWPFLGGFNFAVNPIVPAFLTTGGVRTETGQIVISSGLGRVFRTLDNGNTWQVIGDPVANPGVLDGTNAQALAFGAPDPSPAAPTANFIYAGTVSGNIFVTFTGGGGGAGSQWINISAGLDGSAVQAILTNPTRGSHEAYAVTQRGVYHMVDSAAAGAAWVRITGPVDAQGNPLAGNVFAVPHAPFGDPALTEPGLGGLLNSQFGARNQLTSIVADWRYVIPDAAGIPGTTADPAVTHPMLYVAGQAGVYRSTDDGQTWAPFPGPELASPTPPGVGGGLPNAQVTDLDLALGNINPTTGRPDVSTGPNLLLATTYGRGSFGIRLAPIVFGNTPTQPNILGFIPADQVPGHPLITTNPAPTIIGLGEQSAFGNAVTVTLRDAVTGTAVGSGQTDALGNFRIQVQPGFYTTGGLKTLEVQATNQSGTAGNVARLTFFLDNAPPTPPRYVPDLAPDTDTGRPRPPRDTDNLTNAVRPSFQGTAAGGNLLDPSRTTAIAAGGATELGNTVTITTTTAHGLLVGEVVTIADVATPEYNGTFTVTGVPSATTFTYTNPNLALAASGGGTVTAGVTVTLFVNGVAAGTTTTDATGAFLVSSTVDLAEGANTITVQESMTLPDGTIVVGPMSLPLTVTLDTSPPAPISAVLSRAPGANDDTGASGTDNITSVNTPRFVNSIDPSNGQTQLTEPFALVQIFAQQIDAQGQPIDLVPVLVGEALADAAGNYVVQVGTYVQPLPPTALPNLADGTYLITARQLDVAGNIGQSQGFGSPGTVIIDGTDANDHGFFDPVTGTNQEGWLYIEKALNNIGPNVTNGNKVIVALGATPSQTNGTGGPGGGGANQAGGAIFHPFLQSNLPALGWTLVYIDNGTAANNTSDLNGNGRNDIDEYLSGLPVIAQAFLPGVDGILGTADDVLGTVPGVQLGGAVPPGGLGTGLLYVTTANNTAGDINNAELAIINAHGADIGRFVTGGGGLFSHAESTGSTFVQIAAAPSGATEVGNTVTITTTAAHGVTAGQVVTISGFGGGGIAAGYRGTFTVTSVPSPTTFTYTNPTSGLAPSGGGFVLVPGQGAYGWLTSIFPGIVVVQESAFSLTGVTITPEGMQAFPGLTAADLSTGPWHNYFGGELGVLVPLATALNNAGETVPLILTSIGTTVQPLTVTIDTTAPATPTGLDLLTDSFLDVPNTPGITDVGTDADNVTNAATPSFSIGSIEPGTIVELRRDGVAVPATLAPGTGGGPATLTETGTVPDGLHRYQVRQTDAAGNASGLSAPELVVQVDTVAPTPPSTPRLAQGNDTGSNPNDNLTNVTRPRLLGTGSSANERLRLPGPDGVVGTADDPLAPLRIQILDAVGTIIGEADAVPGPNNTYTYDVTISPALVAGQLNPLTVTARAVDLAGNAGAASGALPLIIDLQAPATPGLTLSPTSDSGVPGDNITSDTSPTFILSGVEGGTVVDLLRDGRVVATRTLAPGPLGQTIELTDPGTVPGGPHAYQARQTDAAGNVVLSGPVTVTIDVTAPTTAPGLALRADTDTGIKGDSRTSLRRPVLVGDTEPGAAVEVLGPGNDGRPGTPDDVILNLPTQADASGHFETQLASDLVNGTISLQARVRDVAGNTGPLGPALTLTISTTLGDYDADGRADLTVYQRVTATPGAAQWAIARSSLGPLVQPFGASTDTPVQADFDGDGVDDLAVFRPETGQWLIRRSRRGDLMVPFGPAGALPVPADYDGDGLDDLAVYVAAATPGAASTWAIQNSSNGLTQTVAFGSLGDVPVPADYDADGRADVAVYRPGAGPGAASQWFILGSREGLRPQVAFGTAGDVPVPIDYDADGRADIAVYRPSPGPGTAAQWFILGSREGLRQVPFGGPGDVPVPRDYEPVLGDGRADLAVFNPNTGQWSILSSATGQVTTTTFGAPGSVPVAAPLPFRQPVPGVVPPVTPGETTAAIAPVSPNPRSAPVDAVVIGFNRPVTGFDLADLRLTRDGAAVSLAGATLASGDGQTWALGNLAAVTGPAGTYVLTLVAAGSGIQGAGASPLAGDASTAFTVLAPVVPPPPPPADTTGPTVVGLRTISPRRRRTIAAVVLTFSEPLDPARAENLGNYGLLASGRDRRFGNRNDRAVPIRLATYDPTTRSVTLTLARPQSPTQAYRLTVFGTTLGVNVADPAGNLLDGDGNGSPGGDFLGRFGRPERPSLSARAVDALATAGDLLSLGKRNRRRP